MNTCPCLAPGAFDRPPAVVTPYTPLLAQLYARPPQPSHRGLERMQALLAALGAPQQRVPSVVVAGTNGKGSTSALIATALGCAGHRVGLFTSPHLLSYRERIRINNVLISREQVVQGVGFVLDVAHRAGLTPTFFEVTTALAMLHFAAHKVDIAVLEVGLGGRLDATNAAYKVLCVLTPISFDHQALLGYDLAHIAAEKAAILAAGVPAVVAPQAPQAWSVIAARLQALGIEATRSGAQQQAFAAQMPPYQRVNFACAQAACQALDAFGPVACAPAAFNRAQKGFTWPGRYQWLRPKDPSVGDLPCPVLLDGGHNSAGAKALVDAIEADPQMQGRRLHFIFAVVHGKDCASMLALLMPKATSFRVCGVQSKRRRDPDALAQSIGHGAQAFENFAAAWRHVLAATPPAEDRIVVCGSLFVIADALAHLTEAERDPPIDA